MSYLTLPSLTFWGRFQADVSTVNNDPRHYANGDFEERFQEFQQGSVLNGWWNPIGTGIFRLDGCSVQAVAGKDSFLTSADSNDPALELTVGNSPDKPSGKLVDLDPEWQLASCIYGQEITLVTPEGRVVLRATFEPAPFRDLWFNRGPAVLGGDGRASAVFQSVLTDLKWDLDGIESPTLKGLAKTRSGKLSIRLVTYAYNGDSDAPGFTYGALSGAIGPYIEDEPQSFVLGRRFMPAGPSQTSANGITCFSSCLDEKGTYLNIDLGNALPVNKHNRISQSLPALTVAVLKDAKAHQGQVVTEDDFVTLGEVEASQEAQITQSGIFTVPISKKAKKLIDDHPVALITEDSNGNLTVEVREQPDGVELRPEIFTFRLDPNDPSKNEVETVFYAARYGEPLAGAKIAFDPQQPPGEANSCADGSNPPIAPCPDANTPEGMVTFSPKAPKTDKKGRAEVAVQGPKTMGNPRGYIDGQLYAINYNFAEGEPQTICQQFDVLASLVFSTFDAPAKPTWRDLLPVLRQYANLYPVMSNGLFDFSKQKQFERNAPILRFVFGKDILDPDYMPVTRDLSSSKRRMILDYLDAVMKETGKTPITSHDKFAARCPMHRMSQPAPVADDAPKVHTSKRGSCG